MLTRRIDSNMEASNSASEFGTTVTNKFLKARNNTIKTVLLVGICFIICWVNDEVYYMMSNLGYDADWDGPYFKFCIAMVYLNCTVNPFVYLLSYQDFHTALRALLLQREMYWKRRWKYKIGFSSYHEYIMYRHIQKSVTGKYRRQVHFHWHLSFSVLKLHLKFAEFVRLFYYQYLYICNTSSNYYWCFDILYIGLYFKIDTGR